MMGVLAFAIDGGFFATWLFVNWLVERVQRFADPSGVDLMFTRIFQVVFGVATLFPILWDLVNDIRSRISGGGSDGPSQ